MTYTVRLVLTRMAKGSGGDRYEGYFEGKEKPLVIYVPQEISRAGDGVSKSAITVTFEV